MKTRRASYARDLRSAEPDQVLFLDQRGHAVSGARRYLTCARTLAPVVGLGGAMSLVVGLLSPAAQAASAAVLGVLLLRSMLRSRGQRRLHAARCLLAAGRPGEAVAIAEAVVAREAEGNATRIAAEQLLARAAWSAGDLHRARRHLEASLAGRRPRGVMRTLLTLAHIRLLALLGEVDRGRALRDALEVPGGDFVQWQLRLTDLYLAFHEGTADELPRALDAWAAEALRSRGHGEALALIAWAHDARGQEDDACRLLAEALARKGRRGVTPPHLAHWMDRKRIEWRLPEPARAERRLP